MTKYQNTILLSLLDDSKTISELIDIVFKREATRKTYTILYCPYCGKENKKKNLIIEVTEKTRSAEKLKGRIPTQKINGIKPPDIRCSKCGERLLKYPYPKRQLITGWEIKSFYEIPYEKKKYLYTNLKRTTMNDPIAASCGVSNEFMKR